MKSQTLILLFVAAGCGLVAMLGVQQVLNKKGEDETPRMRVLQASADIEIGVPLNELNCQYVTVDVGTVPEGAITDFKQTEERQLVIPANTGDWITEKKLGERGLTGNVVNIPDGMQVCTIPVDATTSHSGMLQPGHRVDLMINYESRTNVGDRVQKVKRILQYVEVFAVDDKVYGREGDGQAAKAKNISLLVTPDQALFLELAKTKGRMSTVLRRTGDDTEVASSELTEGDLDSKQGTEIDTRTTLDANMIPTFGVESDDDIFADLQRVFQGEGSAPVKQQPAVSVEPDTWQIAIWEGTNVRVESVNLNSDLPVPVSTNQRAPAPPVQGTFQVPGPPDVSEDEGAEQLEGLEELKEAASDLWSLFGE
jgi:pilus assembly protein CpaB